MTLYKFVGGATLVIASLSILTQIVLLPLIFQYSVQLKNDFQARIRKFHHNTRQFDNQVSRLRELGALKLVSDVHSRYSRQLKQGTKDCPPPVQGPQGPPGRAAEDGEAGDPGLDGPTGLDAYQLLLEEAQKCVECPAGPVGVVGAPGLQGYTGSKGDKGDPGIQGSDGMDGEQGPEGLPGLRGISGKTGKKGSDGASAPGGQGPPGPPGVKGPPGQAGAQGERGKRNYVIGQPGPDGRVGKNGLDGVEGKPGVRGEKGEKGEDGADARFCPCPIEMKLGANKQQLPKQSLLSQDTKAIAYSGRSQPLDKTVRTPPVAESPNVAASNKNGLQQDKSQPQPQVKAIEVHALPIHNIKTSDFGVQKEPVQISQKTAEAVTVANLAYEDAYPNYDGDGNPVQAGSGRKGTQKPKQEQYDDDTEARGGKGVRDDDTARREPSVLEGENAGSGDRLHEGGTTSEEHTDAADESANDALHRGKSRYVYVTKRPRAGMAAN